MAGGLGIDPSPRNLNAVRRELNNLPNDRDVQQAQALVRDAHDKIDEIQEKDRDIAFTEDQLDRAKLKTRRVDGEFQNRLRLPGAHRPGVTIKHVRGVLVDAGSFVAEQAQFMFRRRDAGPPRIVDDRQGAAAPVPAQGDAQVFLKYLGWVVVAN